MPSYIPNRRGHPGEITDVEDLVSYIHRQAEARKPPPPHGGDIPPEGVRERQQKGGWVENLNFNIVTVISFVGFFCFATWFTTSWMSALNYQLKGMEAKIESSTVSLKTEMKQITDSTETRIGLLFSEFCRRTERKNPNWVCPDPIATASPAIGRPQSGTANGQ